MAIATTASTQTALNVVADVPIQCNFALFNETHLAVQYGEDAALAELNVDYTVALAEDFYSFTITPTALLLARFGVDDNVVYIQRVTPLTTDATPSLAGRASYISREFERGLLRQQEQQNTFNDINVTYADMLQAVQSAEIAETNAETAETGAEAARDAAVAAAEASGNVTFFDTKATANAGIAAVPANGIIEVFVDESQSNKRTRYRKESGVYMFKVAVSKNAADIIQEDVELLTGFPRPWIEKFQESVSLKDADKNADDGSTDAADAWDELHDYFESHGGGEIVVSSPDVKYKMSRTLKVEMNNLAVRGANKGNYIFDFATQSAGPGIAVGGCFDFSMKGIAILNAYSDCLELGQSTATGPQASVANAAFENLTLRGSRNGNGLYGEELFMASFKNIRAHLNALKGFKTKGYSTTLSFETCWALANLSDGWDLKNLTYSEMRACGADNNGGHAYKLQDAWLNMIQCGAEANDRSAFELVYDHTNANGSLVPGMGVTVDGFLTLNNNVGLHAGEGDLLKLTSSSVSLFAGAFKIDNWKHVGALNMVVHADGSSNMRIIEGKMNHQALTFATGSGVFAHASDGATDYGKGLPVNINGANTVIGTLGPKLRNGIGSFSCLLRIEATKDNRGSAGRVASYTYDVVKSVAGTSTFTLVSSGGNAAGANAADPGYTFDLSGNNLRASPAGSTAIGNCYFHVSLIGNGVFTPA